MTDRAVFRKLALQIERDLVTRNHVRALLAGVDAALVERRRELRTLKSRLARNERQGQRMARPANTICRI